MDQSTALSNLMAEVEPDDASSPAIRNTHGDKLVIETRFGRFAFDRRHAIAMPKGLPGFPDEQTFALANLPDPRLEKFKLLQSLENPELSFLVAPFNIEAGAIDPEDVEEVLSETGIAREDAAMMLIITVRNTPETGVSVTANMCAPLIIDTTAQIGVQHVFATEKYAIRHPIELAAA